VNRAGSDDTCLLRQNWEQPRLGRLAQMGPIEFFLCGGVPGSDPATREVSAAAGKSTEGVQSF